MRIAHNCFRCGSDLSSRRAPPDPHYHLPVVVCPKCSAACVRTRPEAVAIQRAFLRSFNSYSRLAIQLWLVALCLGATVTGARELADGLLANGPAMPPEDWLVLALTVVAVLGTGAWLGSCFPHQKRPTLLLAWLLIVLSIPLLDSVQAAALTLSENGGARGTPSLPDLTREFGHRVAAEFRGRAPVTRWLMLLAAAQIALSPLGAALIVLNRALVRAKARRRRRILRGSKGPR